MRRPLVAALLAATLMTTLPGVGRGEGEDRRDYDIPNGHFYTQTNGGGPAQGTGFSVTDDLGIHFWSEFQRLGGVDSLGYPISRRFVWRGLIAQALQKAVLQWSPDDERVQIVSVIDYLAEAGQEDWLEAMWHVPSASKLEVSDPQEIRQWLNGQGGDNRKFASFYGGTTDPVKLYGLPTSPPRDLGDLTAIRFQRSVLQLWKVSGPGVMQGSVTSLNVGEVLKASGLLPAEALEVEEAPLPGRVETKAQRVVSRNEMDGTQGVATWYGAWFQGRKMRNGKPFDAQDPHTAAANSFALGSWLRVTNLSNGQSVDVEVTDTGGFRYPIVVDLSWAAFREIADPDVGVVKVLVQSLRRE